MADMVLLGLCGSLRTDSSNMRLLKATQQLVPESVEVKIFENLGEVPLFNPDIEQQSFNAVTQLKASVDAADGIIISSPEYAHGVPGAFKNALDWLVGGHEFHEKPIIFFNVEGRALFSRAALNETVHTMSGNIIHRACCTVPPIIKYMDVQAIQDNPELAELISSSLKRFAKIINTLKQPPPDYPKPG